MKPGPFELAALWLRFQLWAPLRANAHASYFTSHSQFGEDMVVRPILERVQRGFFVDVGAHHPVYYSNTYHYYRRGWRGVNIDAAAGSMDAFRILRPGDVNLELCIGPRDGEAVTFYMFDLPACNTFDAETAKITERTGLARLLGTKPMLTTSLTSCLDRFAPENRRVDLLTIDMEGLDREVLGSLDFDRYRPTVVVFEDSAADLHRVNESLTAQSLVRRGYRIVAKTGPSIVAVNAE